MITFKRFCARAGLRVRAGLKPAPTVVAIVAFFAAIPATAFAGNDDEILIGTQGARLGGAVTATVTDSTALWYNPGAIGRTRWAQFGVTGTLVQARMTSTKFFGMPDGDDASDMELATVPSTLGHEIPLPGNWAFGYGIFSSQAQDRVLTKDSIDAESAAFDRHTYNFGAGLGAPLASTLRVGIGVFAVYENTGISTTSGLSPDVTWHGGRREGLSSFASLGLHWAPTPNWNLGLSLNSPRMLLASTVALEGRELDAGFSPSAPLRVRGGIAHDFGRLVLSLDGDVQPALKNDDALVDRRLLPNARIGADYELDEQTHLGLGLFTDLGPEKNSDQRMDFFGVSGGIETATRYKLDPNEPAESIELSAYIGFRYAVGIGEIAGADATTHEIGINLGSGLRF
jgi:hypothetical protein